MKDDVIKTVVKFLFVWMLWDFVLFNLGRITLLVGTWGRYPRGATKKNNGDRIALVGAVVLIVI